MDKAEERVFCDSVKFWQSENCALRAFLLISFFMLLFFIIMLLQSHPNHVPCPRHLGICESLSVHSWCKCTRIIHCTLYNQQQGDKENRNPSISCVSAAVSPSTWGKKTHEWPLREINSSKKKTLKTAVLILVLWQVRHDNRSRNTEGRNSLDWRHEVHPHSISVTALADTQTWCIGEHKARAPRLASWR